MSAEHEAFEAVAPQEAGEAPAGLEARVVDLLDEVGVREMASRPGLVCILAGVLWGVQNRDQVAGMVGRVRGLLPIGGK